MNYFLHISRREVCEENRQESESSRALLSAPRPLLRTMAALVAINAVLRCKRCAEGDGDEASHHSMRAKRRCTWELLGETSTGLLQINELLSLEGREIPLPSHFVGIMSHANGQTNLKAELLEYIMCSLARMGFVEARECVQDNVELLFASEVQQKLFALLRSASQYLSFQ